MRIQIPPPKPAANKIQPHHGIENEVLEGTLEEPCDCVAAGTAPGVAGGVVPPVKSAMAVPAKLRSVFPISMMDYQR